MQARGICTIEFILRLLVLSYLLLGPGILLRICLLLTDRGDVNMAVYGMKAGASDIVQKPYRNHNLLNSNKQILGITATDT